MRADAGDSLPVEHHYLICILHRRQAMRYYYDGAPYHCFVDRFLDEMLRFGVQGRGRFLCIATDK